MKKVLTYLILSAGTLLLIGPGLTRYNRWRLESILARTVFIERAVPGHTPEPIMQSHLARYNFAKQYCKGKSVADIAAGTGYGAEILRQVASNVDEYDKEQFSRTIKIDLDKSSWSRQYDVIVSFETIEHLSRPQFFLDNIAATSKLLVISTPMNDYYYNPYHKQIWTSARYRSLLDKSFNCEYYRQSNDSFLPDDGTSKDYYGSLAVCSPKIL